LNGGVSAARTNLERGLTVQKTKLAIHRRKREMAIAIMAMQIADPKETAERARSTPQSREEQRYR